MLAVVLPILALLPVTLAQENVLGAYIFHRHGDRTSKSWKPTVLTDLGYSQVYTSGEYYRRRYIVSGASHQLPGIAANTVKLSQISVSSPSDNVLQNSATGFLQGLYPPVNAPADQQTLADGTVVTAPMNGYQLIPVDITSTNTASESTGWLQSTTGCLNAVTSSNEYFNSADYVSLLNSTSNFYQKILPTVNTTFSAANNSYKNAYTIYDYLHVSLIHNSTIQSSSILTNETVLQLRTLADHHEFNLAYNSSQPVRSIAGMQLAAHAVQFLNSTINSKGASNQLGIQFGAYATFSALFGLMNLTTASSTLSAQDAINFRGIVDYASSMVFELYSTSTDASAYTNTANLNVRFLFHNGTSSNTSEPTVYPIFGSSSASMPWTDFVNKMSTISVGTTEQWCNMCGSSSSAVCSASSTTSPTKGSSSVANSGLSNAVAGVIGALVTLAVILGLQAIFMLAGGYRLISKKKKPDSPVAETAIHIKA